MPDDKPWTARQEKLIAAMPKVDLHVHLDGSVRPETIVELAAERGLTLPAGNAEGLLPYMRAPEDCRSLQTYLGTFAFVLAFLQDGEALERVAYELAGQAAGENCLYMEVRFAPQLHTGQGLSLEAVIGHVIRGLKRGESDFGITARAIVICMRNHGAEDNLAVLEAAAHWQGRGVVAVDLAGDEACYPAGLFAPLFRQAGKLGLPVTIHAGEAAGPDNIREAIVNLGARRIGHGVRIREEREVLELVRAARIPLEMCPISNLQTRAVADWASYPLRQYAEEGLLVTVNTDNRTVSGTTLALEYRKLIEHCGVSVEAIAGFVRNGLHAAFIEEPVKQKLLRQFEAACLALKLGAD
ncbi:adenosine deaminase [Paenibacillus nasutitermitis]|uniref:adenosine deaminase n=1 Tax=Paenibacillus nasutitermitis TaxID=1652958 RepID=A0A916ZEU9_9BACL|nr:adenosine deaminase [Paenibacillus nasutitermitis]GGD93192.1 adenosine deaminase [Paenibacillus nasutitermitis]